MSTVNTFIPYDAKIFVESETPTQYSKKQSYYETLIYYTPRGLEFDNEEEYLNYIKTNMTDAFNKEYPDNKIIEIQVEKARSYEFKYPMTSRLSMEIGGKSYDFDFYFPSLLNRRLINQGCDGHDVGYDACNLCNYIARIVNGQIGGISDTSELYIDDMEQMEITWQDVEEYNTSRLLTLLKNSSLVNRLKYTLYCILKRYKKYPSKYFINMYYWIDTNKEKAQFYVWKWKNALRDGFGKIFKSSVKNEYTDYLPF